MKKTISMIAILASIAMTFSACSSSKSDYSNSSYDATYDYAVSTTAASAYEYSAEMAGGYNDYEQINTKVTTELINDANTPTEEYSAKIIRNARLSMESIDVKKSYEDFITYVNDNGGYEFSMDMSSNEKYTSISATIKIKPSKLDGAIAYASECGTVLSSNVSSEDITSDYYDVKIRLENKYKNLDKYYEYLENAHEMSEIIQLQNQIDYITSDIEAFEGRLRMWDTLTSESTINIYIGQKDDPNAPVIEEEVEEFNWHSMTAGKMFLHMSNGFKKTCNGLFSIIQWLVIVIVTLLPILVVAGIIVFIAVKRHKKKKAMITEIMNKPSETPIEVQATESKTDTTK